MSSMSIFSAEGTLGRPGMVIQYDIALTIILLIAAMVIVVDQITGKLRKELLK